MAKITIIRPYEWANQQKRTLVYIDGKKVGDVGIDQTAHFDVTPDKHSIELKQKWSGGSKLLDVDLSDNKDVTIKMKSFKYNWIILIIIFPLINSAYLTLMNIDNFIVKVLGSFLVVGLIYLIIYMLFLRTRFIKLEEISVHTDI